jgi:hypothetical protein
LPIKENPEGKGIEELWKQRIIKALRIIDFKSSVELV